MTKTRSYLLVASPHLPDPNFYRSVVLVIEHVDDGALGVILNRESNTPLETVWKEACDTECRSNQSLHIGGPVEGPLMALHTCSDLDGVEIAPKVFFSSEKSTLEALVERAEKPFRIFSGYAGWGPGQLDGELQMGGWLKAPLSRDELFSDVNELWKRVTHRIGAEITERAFRTRHVPADPLSN